MKAAAFLSVAAGVGLGSAAPATTQPFAPPAFQACTDAAADPALAGSLCAFQRVALDQSGPSRDTVQSEEIELFVRQFPPLGGAPPRGQVWLIAGGPGESGASFYAIIANMRRAFPGFTLVVPDHRGTGLSSRLCPHEEAPESPGGFDLSGDEWVSCPRSMFAAPERARAFSVTNAAYDLAQLITRLRDGRPTHIYAVSYGTQLLLRMMLVAPVSVDSIILDGLVPPEGSVEADLGRRTAIVDAVGRRTLDAEREAAYRLLLKRVNAPWQRDPSIGDLRVTMASFLAFSETRLAIPEIIDRLSADDVAPLAQTIAQRDTLSGVVNRFAQPTLSLPLVMLVSGSENNDRREITAEMVIEENTGALFVSPLPALLPRIVVPLYPRDRFYGAVPPKLPSTLVVHGTLDASTPFDAAIRHIELLKPSGTIRLATVEGGPHFLALTAPDCFVRIAVAFVSKAKPLARCAMP